MRTQLTIGLVLVWTATQLMGCKPELISGPAADPTTAPAPSESAAVTPAADIPVAAEKGALRGPRCQVVTPDQYTSRAYPMTMTPTEAMDLEYYAMERGYAQKHADREAYCDSDLITAEVKVISPSAAMDDFVREVAECGLGIHGPLCLDSQFISFKVQKKSNRVVSLNLLGITVLMHVPSGTRFALSLRDRGRATHSSCKFSPSELYRIPTDSKETDQVAAVASGKFPLAARLLKVNLDPELMEVRDPKAFPQSTRAALNQMILAISNPRDAAVEALNARRDEFLSPTTTSPQYRFAAARLYFELALNADGLGFYRLLLTDPDPTVAQLAAIELASSGDWSTEVDECVQASWHHPSPRIRYAGLYSRMHTSVEALTTARADDSSEIRRMAASMLYSQRADSPDVLVDFLIQEAERADGGDSKVFETIQVGLPYAIQIRGPLSPEAHARLTEAARSPHAALATTAEKILLELKKSE